MKMLISALCILAVLGRSCLAGGKAAGHDKIIPQFPVIERGSSINLSCILDKKHLSYTNSSGVFWRLNDDLIPQEYYTIVSETVSNVTIHNFTAPSGHLKCSIYHPSHPQLLHQTELKSGYLPEVPQNISCVYFHMTNFSCAWDPGRNTALQTEYVLMRKVHSSETSCQTTINACSFLYPDLHFSGDYEVSVKAKNALGEVTSDVIRVNTLHLVKTAPPEVISVEPISGLKQMLKVVWKRPLLAPIILPVKCILKYRTNSSDWVESNVVLMDMKELGMFNLSGLLDAREYTVAVRCIGTAGQIHWSDWSAEKTGTTAEQAPLRKVDLWRVIDSSQSNGNRTVHLMWKLALPYSGKTLGYRVQYFLESNTSQKITGKTTEKAITFNITGETYFISVVAYNSAGDSPEATLRIPPIGEEPQQLLVSVHTLTHNDQLVVRWNSSVSAVDGYVVEWCVDSDYEICGISWQHVPNSTEWTFKKGSFEPFKCYNISVYPLFDDKVGAPYFTQVYIAEGPPQHGPSAKADNLGKNEVTIKWEKIPKDERNGFITNYTIVYMAYSENQMTKTVKPNILEYTLTSLQPNTLYNAYIIASTRAGMTNGSIIHFRTLQYRTEEIVSLSVAIPGSMIFIVFIGGICSHNKLKLKRVFWPNVPDPAASSMAEWFEAAPKMNPLLNIQSDGILRVENINVLDSFYPTENQSNCIREYPKNGLESITRAHNCTYSIEQDFAKPPSPLSYVTAETGYKSQTPSGMSGEGRSESMSCLLHGLSSDDDETQDTTVDEAFEGEAAFSPYLKNSVMNREFIFPVDCSDLKAAEPKQQLMIIAPCQHTGLGKHYVTVDMLGLKVAH